MTVALSSGGQFLFADHATDFGAAPTTAANSLIIGTPTDVQMDLTNLAASGGARESAKFDFGATWAGLHSVDACIEFETAPTDGETVDFWIAFSPSSTAGTGNPGSLTGADAAYTETDGKLGQMRFVGSLPLENDVINIGHVGTFTPLHRYGILVIENNGSTNFRSTATAMDETHIIITEVDHADV